jgi:vitamin B12 transporter
VENTGLVGQYDVVFDERLALGAAVRYDDNDLFESAATWRGQISYRFDSGFRAWGAAGTGAKNPTFFELFGFDPNTFIGNPDLEPETSTGWEVGLERSFADRALISVAYFDSTLKDELFTAFLPGFVSSPQNRVSESTQRGLEFSGGARFADQWRIDASYTWLDADEDGTEEIRRPSSIGSVNIGWRAQSDRGGLNLTVRFNGETDDTYFGASAVRVTLPSYTLVNVGADFRINDTLQLYGRVENALDEDYEEVYGFRTAGIGAYAGLRASF